MSATVVNLFDFRSHRCPRQTPEQLARSQITDQLLHRVGPSIIAQARARAARSLARGVPLAQAIRRAVTAYVKRLSRPPRVILLENHGLIALGGTPEAVLAATLMAVKAAEIFTGASALGTPRFMTPASVARIAGRPDEHYRQKALGL